MKFFAGSLAAHLGIWALLQQVPQDDSAAAIDLASREPTSIASTSTTTEEPPPAQDPDQGTGGKSEGEAKAMALEEGQAGKPTSNREAGHMEVKNTNHEVQMSREEAIEEARTAGVLGNMRALEGGFQSATAIGDVSSAWDDANMYGAIYGADAGESHGYFGMGRSGFGRGGGCTQEPCGLIGTSATYGTIGTGAHAGTGWGGPGGFGPRGHNHEPGVPRPVIGQATGGGDLDKGIIRRYIKRNIDKIGYCYEHELLAHPSMEGTVTVQFFISPAGTVQGSKGSGFDNTVATCVAGVIGSIEFPKPQGGGGVEVNYPFTFHAVSGN